MSAPLSIETRTEALRRVLTTTAAHGWEFSLWEGAPDEEPRIRDVDAAERLGYERPRKIRELIERLYPGYSGLYVRDAVEVTPMPRGGARKTTVREAWLTEAQLLKVIARSETAIAEAILDEMIRVYMAVRRHLSQTIPVVGHARALPGRKGLPAPEVKSKLTAAETATLRAAAKTAGMSVEDFIDRAITTWVRDLETHRQHPELVTKHRPDVKISTVFAPVTMWMREAVETKALAIAGSTSPAAQGLAVYALLEMGMHLQHAHDLASMTFKKR